jgi:hypothetical protein
MFDRCHRLASMRVSSAGSLSPLAALAMLVHHPATMHRIRLWNSRYATNAIGLALAGLLSAGCASLLSPVGPPPDESDARPSVSVEIVPTRAGKGEGIRLRLRRDVVGDALTVRLRFEGDARYGLDYALEGADAFDGAVATLTIPPGEATLDLTFAVVEEVPYAAEETLSVTLEASPGHAIDETANRAGLAIPRNDFAVITTDDEGPGSLRQALSNAIAQEGPATVRFDTTVGPFATPQTIVLSKPLPQLRGDVTIDGRIEDVLWKATGVTVSGANRYRVFDVAPGARIAIRNLSIAEGLASDGAGVANRGALVVQGVTFRANEAIASGGGILNLEGTLAVINSTFVYNRASESGGGLAVLTGHATVTNSTFSRNRATRGGGIFNAGELLLRNSILANSPEGDDCSATGSLDPVSTHNLMENSYRCGTPITRADPRFGPIGFYNGPTPTLPIGGGSPAVNLGDNDSAVDENGERLVWDQRGNGDPRFVAGITDVGAFEHQRLPVLVVDTPEDSERFRACTPAGAADCSLRGAIQLVNASPRVARLIRFDGDVFAEPQTIRLVRALPRLTTDVTIDASGTGGLTVRGKGRAAVFDAVPGSQVTLVGVTVEPRRASRAAPGLAGR